MRQALCICRKELNVYFASPIAYIVIAIFLLVTGWFFFSTFFLFNQASLRGFFRLLPVVFAFVVPAVTMRQFAEELNIGSYEILLTMPLRFTDIVIGKFMASVAFVAAMLAPTLAYPAMVAFLGALLLGAAFSAVGLFASALTRNQIVAFIIGLAVCFALTLVDQMVFFLPHAFLKTLAYLAADAHFENIAKGVIDTRDVVYFLSVCFIGLYGTVLVLKAKN